MISSISFLCHSSIFIGIVIVITDFQSLTQNIDPKENIWIFKSNLMQQITNIPILKVRQQHSFKWVFNSVCVALDSGQWWRCVCCHQYAGWSDSRGLHWLLSVCLETEVGLWKVHCGVLTFDLWTFMLYLHLKLGYKIKKFSVSIQLS